MNFHELLSHPFYGKLVNSLVLLIILIGIRFILRREILSREKLDSMVRRRWMVSTRNALTLILIAGLVIIWMEQLRTLAAGILLVAAAVVIATKELILNLTGFFFRTGARFFTIGDRIEINNIRGDVVDQSMMGTTILEIGPGAKSHQYTGRAVFVPNALFLGSPVTNETYMEDFIFHIITVPLKDNIDWQKAEESLLEAANEACEPFLEKARSHMNLLARKYSLDAPTVEPRIQLHIPAPGQIELLLRVPIPARRKGRMEQAIMRSYLLKMKEIQMAQQDQEEDRTG